MKLKWITIPVVTLLLLLSLPYVPAGDLPDALAHAEQVNIDPLPPPIYKELGIPTALRYPDGDVARVPWDMVLYNGSIYLGSGDYDKNRGPADIWRYDIDSGAFTLSGTVPDEEVSRFRFIFDRLAAPGTDPKDDWEMGNYYVCENGAWTTYRNLPSAIHAFDMIEYQGKIFAGLGVQKGNAPIVCSYDGGQSFLPVTIYQDGGTLNTGEHALIRVYDFFLCNGNLYAALSLEDGEKAYWLYRYDPDQNAFFFEKDLLNPFDRFSYKHGKVGEKVNFDGKLFLTTGYLYQTTDMQSFAKISFGDGVVVTDLALENNTLYALCSYKKKDGSEMFATAVYALKVGEGQQFTKLFEFDYDVPAMSMVVTGNDFYIGMGNGKTANPKNGMLLLIRHES